MKHSRLFHGAWLAVPRVLWRYPRQEWTGKVWVLTDSNWAACPVTRKSSSATYLMLGKHPIFAESSRQTSLSLSSGEAEFYRAVRCACRTLGLKSLMSDLSLEVKAELVTDSSACKGLCSRRGAGKNSTHPLSCTVASTRRGTTTDCDYSACGKGLGSRCRDKGGHPRRHHVATAGHVWTGHGRRSSEASVEPWQVGKRRLEDMATLRLHDLE